MNKNRIALLVFFVVIIIASIFIFNKYPNINLTGKAGDAILPEISDTVSTTPRISDPKPVVSYTLNKNEKDLTPEEKKEFEVFKKSLRTISTPKSSVNSSDSVDSKTEKMALPPGDKIFTTGGLEYPYFYPGNAWVSNDGISYTNVGTNLIWSSMYSMGFGNGRVSFPTVYFQGKVWIFGGYDGNGSNGCRNDIWSSVDGEANWRREVENAPWSGRAGHTVTEFNNKLYLIGGTQCNNTISSEIWESSDGVNWTIVEKNSLLGRVGHTTQVLNGKMYVMGGFTNYQLQGYINDVIYTTNGSNWTVATPNAVWADRANHTSVVYDKKLWVFGGVNASNSSISLYLTPFPGPSISLPLSIYSDVWNSSDGVTWNLVTSNAPWGPREAHTSVVFDNKMWVLGGSTAQTGSYLNNEAWNSIDGLNWTLAGKHIALEKGNYASVVTPASYGQGTFLLPDVSTDQGNSTTSTLTLMGTVDPKNTNTTSWYGYVLVPWQSNVATETNQTPVSSVGTFSETIANIPPGTNYMYRIVSQNENGLVQGDWKNQSTQGCNSSPNPQIRIISPNGGETFQSGQTITVNWETCNIPATDLIKIGIWGTPGWLVQNTPNDGTEQIILNNWGNRRLRIVDQTSGAWDVSDSTFLIQ